MYKSGIELPRVAFSTIDYLTIPDGSYFVGFNLENGDKLSKMDSLGNITIIGCECPGDEDVNFIFQNICYVDPNGDNTTGELGNIQKPFATPGGALQAFADYLQTIVIATSPYLVSTVDGNPDFDVLRRYSYRFKIHVFPGVYLAADEDLEDLDTYNLMYNYVDWYFEPGAILSNYVFNDSYSITEESTTGPTYCNVYGHGTFVSKFLPFSPLDVTLITEGSVLNLEGDFTQFRYDINAGICRSNFKSYVIFQSEVFVGSGSSVYGGQLLLKSDTVRWILDGSTDTLSFTSAFYVGAGRLDIEFGSYSAISAPLLTDPPILPEDIANLYGGSLMWDETIEQPAPYLGYFEENLYGLPNTNVRIKVDRGIFGGLIAIHEGGYFEFFPGDLEVVAQLTGFELGTQTYGFYLGGPYDVITQSKFICHGGIINFIGVGDTYGEGIEFYDDPSFYFKDTQFIWDENHSAVNAIAYYGSNRDYARDLILDGAKFYVKSDDLSFMYPFKITPNFGEPSELQIRIYGNCFSNMNQFIVNPEDLFSTVVNLVPNTDFIVSDEVKLLKKYF